MYSSFYDSDIIVASPLGLRTIIGSEGDAKRDYDFLSSISLCIMDLADVIAMQNWEHVTTLFSHLNLIPTKPHDCDFSRIKDEYLDGLGKTIRQTVFLSKYPFPELKALVGSYFDSLNGSTTLAIPLIDIGQAQLPVSTIKIVKYLFVFKFALYLSLGLPQIKSLLLGRFGGLSFYLVF